jgi:predicted amidohydrolase YtcJ
MADSSGVMMLYRNGRILAASDEVATAMIVEDGVISWVGPEDRAAEFETARTVDLAGALVTPAFVDAHVHTTATGLALTGLDLRDATTLADALRRIEQAARAARGRPILGSGWDETGWPETRPPTAAELDRAAYGGAVYLSRIDAHSAVVSSALLHVVPGLSRLAGFDRSGWLRGAANEAAHTSALAAVGARHRRSAQLAALRRAAALGIASVHEMGGPTIAGADDLAELLELAGDPGLPEVIGYWAELLGIETARDLGAVGAAGDVWCDGSLGSHTAALREPYTDRPETQGVLRYTTADLAEHLERCTNAGLQAGFHAIGDAAVDQVLDAVDLVTARTGRVGGAGHRIEHAEYVHDPARLAASGLVASMQPRFDALWGGPDRMYAARLGPDRARGLNRFADLATAGVPMAFGSDAPVTELGPWAAVRAAAYPSDPAAAIGPLAAFDAHTRAGWRAAGRVDEGVLTPGAPATFAIWAASEVAGDAPDEQITAPGLPDLRPDADLPACLATVRNGVALHDAGILTG